VDAVISLTACEHRDNPTPENCTPADSITVFDPVRTLGQLPAGFIQLSRFGLQVTGVPTGRQMIDLDVCLAGSKTGQPAADCKTFTLLAQADEEKRYYITDCPDGCTGVKFDRNGDEVYENRVSRNPFDTLDLVRRGLPEKNINYESLRDAADENNNGIADCEEGGNDFTCGNPDFTGPWDFDTDREGFRTGVYELSEDSTGGISNFGEDTNWNDSLDGDEDGSKIGSTFTIDYNWGTGGGCGWASNNEGAGPGGVFHTGTIGNWDSSHDTQECRPDGIISGTEICEPHDVYSGTAGEKFWFEYLRTPEIHPVHFGTDPRDGFDWRTQILDYSWAIQWDQADGNSVWTWEFDLDTTDGDQLLGDNTLHGIYGGGPNGLISGGNFPLYDGALVFAPTNADVGSANYGNEENGTIGGNREAKRGCWFNVLSQIDTDVGNSAADRPLNLPRPVDDDCDNEYDLGPDGCPGECGVDDDNNGAVDDPLEICPCMRCEGGPRAGIACTKDLPCNPDADDPNHYDCVLDVDPTNGTPTAFGDDVCGGAADPDDGSPSPDEGVFSEFELASTGERVTRQASPNLGNGVGGVGRPSGNIRYNTLEDFFGPVGSSWQAEIGFLVLEPEGDPALDGYGMTVDEVVVEWLEARPIDQTEDKCGINAPAPEEFEGRCARVMLAEENNTFAGDRRLEVSVLDPEPAGNEVTCPSGARGVEVTAFSEAEPQGETLCLEETSAGGTHFAGLVQTTTKIQAPDDGLVYTDFNGLVTPTLTVRYVDKNDGVHATDNGPDGQPGIAGFDDDGDGTTDEADELCPTTSQLAPGRSPHLAGQPSRYSDDNCGCLDNPIDAVTFTQFDVADVIIEEVFFSDDGDDDGFADPGEKVTATVVFRNLADFPIEDLVFRASSGSDYILCFGNDDPGDATGDTAKIDRIEARQPGCITPDPAVCSDRVEAQFSFIVADDVTRNSLSEELRSGLEVTMNGLAKATRLSENAGRRAPRDADRITEFDIPISGFAVRQFFEVEHNLSPGSEGTATTYENDFEAYANDAALFNDWRPRTEGDDVDELDGNRCQYNDPFNPFGNSTEPQEYCEVGEETDNTVHDWHLSSLTGCDSQGLTTCQKGQGGNVIKSHGPGDQSLAMNWLAWGYTPFLDNPMSYHANRIQWIEKTESIQLLSAAAGAEPPKLEMWTMVSLADTRAFVGPMPRTLDAAVTGVCVDRNGNNQCDTINDGDGTERWEVIDPKINPYSSWKAPNFINCAYDPTDDGSTEDDFFENSQRYGPSSTCYPNLVESCLGRTSDPSFIITSVYQHPTCFPETGDFDVEVPGLYETASTGGGTGTGVWAKQVYDLSKYRGQKILLRFLSTGTGIAGVDIWGNFVEGFLNADDGWYIDDIVVTGVSSTDFNLSIDNAIGGSAGCPTTTCGSATSRVAVLPYPRNDKNGEPKPAAACTDATLEYCDFDEDGTVDSSGTTADSPAPRQAFVIEARESETDTCFGGALEFRFEIAGGEVLSDWSTLQDILVDPLETTTYDVSVRCSTDTSCENTQSVTIDVPPYTPRDFTCRTNNLVLQTDKQTINWDPDGNDACPAEWDVAKGTSFGSTFFDNQSCLEDNSTDTQSTDPADPNPGFGFWYVSRHTGEDGSYSTGTPAEEPGRDDNITACP
jgi:hypothetical protein